MPLVITINEQLLFQLGYRKFFEPETTGFGVAKCPGCPPPGFREPRGGNPITDGVCFSCMTKATFQGKVMVNAGVAGS